MKLSTAIHIVSVTLFATVVSASNMTYNVISLIPNSQTVAVMIDNQIYPLVNTNINSPLLYSGDAPHNTGGYKYAIIYKQDNSVLQAENFTRIITDETKQTLNEYYNRTWNSFPLDKLPTILPPLPIINRIQSDLHIDGEIPTVHLIGSQTEIDAMHNNQTSNEIEVYLNMAYISPKDLKTFQNISVSISGHSTRGLAKLSYKLKLNKDQDLYGYRKIKLRSMSADLSYMKEELAYDIANSVGLPTSQYSYARVYINDQAIGLFGLSDNLKSPWVRNEFGNGKKDFKQGALYVADPSAGRAMFGSDAVFGQNNQTQEGELEFGGNYVKVVSSDLSHLGNNVSLYAAGQFNVKEDPSVGTANYTRIMDLTEFISQQPNVTTNDVIPLWQEKINVDSFLRGLALEIVISNSDGYLTVGNNFILYDDIENERLVFSGQDFDITMGTTFYNTSLMHGGDYTEFPGFQVRPLMHRLLAVPQFKQDFENLLINITRDLVNPQILNPRIDQLVEMLREDVAWDKSLSRVGSDFLLGAIGGGNNSTMGQELENIFDLSFETAVNGPSYFNFSMSLKDWLKVRSSNLLTFFNQPVNAATPEAS